MIPEITSCPNCQTLVLDDTVACPSCNYIFKPEHESVSAGILKAVSAAQDQFSGQKETQCKTCGENVREGSVRCWNCGSFLQEDIESHFLQMQARPVEVITSEKQDLSAETIDAVEFEEPEQELGEDDFLLSSDIFLVEIEQDENPQVDLAEQEDSDDPGAIPLRLDGDSGETESETIPLLNSGEKADSSSGEAQNAAGTTDEEDDPLLNLAMQEEKETHKRFVDQSKRIRKQTVLLKGPCGDCQIRVPVYNQGKMGRCPKCMLQFMVPILKSPTSDKAAQTASASTATNSETTAPGAWLVGKWHQFPVQKRPTKPHSLATKGDEIDIHVGQHGLLLLWPDEKPSLLKSAVKLRGNAKTAVNSHLNSSPASAEFPVKNFLHFPAEKLSELVVSAPAVADNSVVPLYANGQIAILVPGAKDDQVTELVLSLSSYRAIVKMLQELQMAVPFHNADLIPIENDEMTHQCAFAEESFASLKHPAFYEADPAFQLEPAGWSCQNCEAVISEASRIEQSFGGKKPKGLSKAVCPKCQKPFGHQPLWEIQTDVTAAQKISAENETSVAE